jgi:hypothetical protein
VHSPPPKHRNLTRDLLDAPRRCTSCRPATCPMRIYEGRRSNIRFRRVADITKRERHVCFDPNRTSKSPQQRLVASVRRSAKMLGSRFVSSEGGDCALCKPTSPIAVRQLLHYPLDCGRPAFGYREETRSMIRMLMVAMLAAVALTSSAQAVSGPACLKTCIEQQNKCETPCVTARTECTKPCSMLNHTCRSPCTAAYRSCVKPCIAEYRNCVAGCGH